ncbi:MAG: YciI family protein [Candidatus Acidiferrales bacterium]
MSPQHFFMKLIPPRPTFALDMTAEERALMQEHVKYVGEAFSKGKVLIYGPVMDTTGAFGMAVVEMSDAAEVQRFGEEDPSVKAGMNTFEFDPMRVGQARAKT